MMHVKVIRQLPFKKEVDTLSVVNHMGQPGVMIKAVTAAFRFRSDTDITYIMVRTYKEAESLLKAISCGFYPGYNEYNCTVFKTSNTPSKIKSLLSEGNQVFVGTEKGFHKLADNSGERKINRIICIDTPNDSTILYIFSNEGNFYYSYIPGIPVSEKINDKLIKMYREKTLDRLSYADVRSMIN